MFRRSSRATCSCHPDSLARKFVAALDAEAVSIVAAFAVGILIGGCGVYAVSSDGQEYLIERGTSPEGAAHALATYCDQNMMILANGEVIPNRCASRLSVR